MFSKRLKNNEKQPRKWRFSPFGKKLRMVEGSSEFLPLTLDTLEKEARAKSRRKLAYKGLAIASLGILLSATLVQAGSSFMGSSLMQASAANKQGTKTDAITRAKNQLEIAAKKADGSLTSGEWAMSDSELKTIGFYLSNFYTPFTTKMGKGSSVKGNFTQDVQTILEKVVKVNGEHAKDLAKAVVAQSNASQKVLKLAKSEDGGKTWKSLNMNASYYEVLFGSVGLFTKEMLTTNDLVSLTKRYDWKNNGQELLGVYASGDSAIDAKNLKRKHISYEWNPDPTGASTISQAVFYANFSATGKASWGSSFITVDGSDKKMANALKSDNVIDGLIKATNSASSIKKLESTIEGIYKRSIYSANMYIDSFGNLLSKTGGTSAATYVILPASQNPMMYASKGDSTSSESSSEESSESDKKEESKSESTSNTSKKKNSLDEFNSLMDSYYNSDTTGVGKQLPLNNLNTLALLTVNGGSGINLNVTGKGTVSLSANVTKTITPVFSISNKGFDETTNFLNLWDSGALTNNLLYSQWLLSRVPIKGEEYKKFVKTFGVDAKKGEYLKVTDSHEIAFNAGVVNRFPAFAKSSGNQTGTGFFGWITNEASATKDILAHLFNAQNEVDGADTFAEKFQSSSGQADALTFKPSISLPDNLPVIDHMVAFDKYNFAQPDIGATSDILKTARMTENDTHGEDIVTWKEFANSRIKNGVWVGTGKGGSLADSLDVDTDDKYGVNIYVSTYLARALPTNEGVGFVINLENSPQIVETSNEDDISDENMDAVLKNMAYYMLNPTMGREYKQRWSKTFVNQVLLVSLEDMIGANTASSYAGTTRYLELTGLAVIPRMDEIKFTSMLYEAFDTWGVFILIVASIIMLVFVFVGQVKVIPAIVSILAFGVMVYTPPKMVNSMINLTNTVSNAMFKDKFTFWVMATHQNYEDSLAQLAESAESNNVDNYTAMLLQLQSGLGSSDTGGETDVYEWQQTLGATIKVRWMAPKKDGYVTQAKREFESIITEDGAPTDSSSSQDSAWGILKPAKAVESEESKESSDSEETTESSTRSDNQTMQDGAYNGSYSPLTSALMANGLSNEDFTGLDTNYLYRGYTDISDYSRFYYGNIMGDNISGSSGTVFDIGSYTDSLSKMFPSLSDDMSASDSVSAHEQRSSIIDYLSASSPSVDNRQTLLQRSRLGFMNDRKGSTKDGVVKNTTLKRIFAPISSSTVSKQSAQDIRNIKVGDMVGLDADNFILTIRNFQNHESTLQSQMADLNKESTGISLTDGDATSLSTFALYTESPFYYLSWNLYDNGLSPDTGSSGEFKTMMLENNDSFFYNYQIEKGKPGYGALKDFMDFGSLFTVVIPYLREANKTLLQWDDTYGTKPFDGYGVTKADLDAITDKNSEAYYKTWFNYSADNAYRTYSAWVDALYDLDIAQPETIEYGGIKQEVTEPINPASYKVRPMVFSESEMEYYGMTDSDLTRVERAILKTSRDIRNRWLDLMNYYTLDDVVLNTSASMMATFAFNENFSQKGFNQNQIVLEPQGFELKTFGFDAYLRMILQNATGESIAYNQSLKSDIYEIVAEKDGTATLIAMWILAVIVVYFIPTAILVTLCALPIAMLLSVLASFIRQDRKFAKTFARDCLSPFLTVLGVNLGIAYVVSVLMGNGGYNLVTGDIGNSQSFSSPRSTVFFLIFIALVAVYVYFMSLRNLFVGLWKNAKLVSIPVKASVEVMASSALGAVSKIQKTVTGSSSSKSGGGSSTQSADKGIGGTGTGRSIADQSRDNLSTTSAKKRRFGFGKRKSNAPKSPTGTRYDARAKQLVDDAMGVKPPKGKPSSLGAFRSEQAHDKAKGKVDDAFKDK